MKQIARNLTDVGEGFLRGARHLIHDRDPLFTQEFRGILRARAATRRRLAGSRAASGSAEC